MRLPILDLLRLSIALHHCNSQRTPSHFASSVSAIILLFALALLEYANICTYISINCSPQAVSLYGSFQTILSLNSLSSKQIIEPVNPFPASVACKMTQ